MGVDCNWTTPNEVGIIGFDYNGNISSRIGNLGTYTYDTWYKVKMKYERVDPDTVKLSYWLDDAFKGTQNVSAASYEDDLSYFHFGSGDGTIWVDEIEVRCLEAEVCDPFIDIILNDTDLTPGETLTAELHITNDATPDIVDLKIWLELPGGFLLSWINVPNLPIPANTDVSFPIFSYTFSGAELAGDYNFGGRFLNWINGDILCKDVEPFSFTP